MNKITNQTFDEERALYASDGIELVGCRFDGVADGESALKESRNVSARDCYFNLRYPFWHDENVKISECHMTELCRAALWYSGNVTISGTKMHGTKALLECREIKIHDCDIRSAEFGWFNNGIEMRDSSAEGEYFMMRSTDMRLSGVTLKGKYSFQYIENCVFENCNFDTKDAFWHAKHVTVRNSTVKGEYLGWYCEDVTFENCVIIGTQPLCYCTGLKLIGCEMHECDLAFEKSEVTAEITTPVISIKNPKDAKIVVPSVDEIIMNDPAAKAEIKKADE